MYSLANYLTNDKNISIPAGIYAGAVLRDLRDVELTAENATVHGKITFERCKHVRVAGMTIRYPDGETGVCVDDCDDITFSNLLIVPEAERSEKSTAMEIKNNTTHIKISASSLTGYTGLCDRARFGLVVENCRFFTDTGTNAVYSMSDGFIIKHSRIEGGWLNGVVLAGAEKPSQNQLIFGNEISVSQGGRCAGFPD